MVNNDYSEDIIACIQAVNIFKTHKDYEKANLFFNSLIEHLLYSYEDRTDGYDFIENVTFGIEQSSCEYYALAFIEFDTERACIPTPLLSNFAARLLLVQNFLVYEDKKLHNRRFTDFPYFDDELEIIKKAEKFLNYPLKERIEEDQPIRKKNNRMKQITLL